MFNSKNNKRIKDLEQRVETLFGEVNRLKENPPYFSIISELPDDSMIGIAVGMIRALEDYLKVEIGWDWKDKPGIKPPKVPQIRVWSASKKETKKDK